MEEWTEDYDSLRIKGPIMQRDNVFEIKSVSVGKNRIDYDYEIRGEWSEFFNTEEKLFIEFSEEISALPESVAVLPLLGNILPIAWVCDALIIVPSIDKSFYDSIPDFKKGYIEMHPKISFKGELKAGAVEQNTLTKGSGCLALFSGGVDAFSTLVNHMDEKPTLVTIWGADVKLDDVPGWKNVSDHVDSVCSEFGLDKVSVKSNFRSIIREGVLDSLVAETGDGWWHGFQHGLALITHTAPIANVKNKSIVYIASSFTIEQKGVSCASDPTIDNFIRFGNTKVVHDGYEFNRQMKLRIIANYVKKSGHRIRVHVCWRSEGGRNCCRCEKCMRTILGLYATGEDPKEYGFGYSDFSDLCLFIKNNRWVLSKPNFVSTYTLIQKSLQETYSYKEVEPNLRWFYKADLNRFNPYPLGLRIKNKLRRLLSRFK